MFQQISNLVRNSRPTMIDLSEAADCDTVQTWPGAIITPVYGQDQNGETAIIGERRIEGDFKTVCRYDDETIHQTNIRSRAVAAFRLEHARQTDHDKYFAICKARQVSPDLTSPPHPAYTGDFRDWFVAA